MKAVCVENVSKKFMLRNDRPKNLAEGLRSFLRRNRRREFWALKDINFDVRAGEAIGLIGHNGAGKSTMLKVLTGILEPNEGEVSTAGRVSALIEVGAGFHQEMTGRENIYLNGTILGMTRTEIKRKLDAIISFAELEDFIDTPVKRYSSGMYARLGFAVAAHVEPQVLLVDEVLAVGDLAFQTKCFRHMRELISKGCAVILVTHSMYSAKQLCSRLLWIHEGQVRMDGPADTVAQAYQAWASERSVEGPGCGGARWGAGGVRIRDVDTNTRASGDGRGVDVDIIANIHVEKTIHAPVLWIMISNTDGYRITGTTTRRQPGSIPRLDQGDVQVRCTLKGISLVPGLYRVTMGVFDSALVPLDRWGDCAEIFIEPYTNVQGLLTADFDGCLLVDSNWAIVAGG